MRHLAWLVIFGVLYPLVATGVAAPSGYDAHSPLPDLLPSTPAPIGPSGRLAAAIQARDAAGLAAVVFEAAGASDGFAAAGEPTIALPVGDLTGDARADALLLSRTIAGDAYAIEGVAGESGVPQWSRSWSGIDGLAPFAVPDATGDDRDDLLVLTLAMSTPQETTRCALVACVVRTSWTHAWGLTLVSGATGADAWSRSWPGGASVTFVDSFLGGVYQMYDAQNLSLFVAPPALDAPWSLTVTAYDVEERGLFANVASRGEALSPGGGTLVARGSAGSPDVGYLFPAGDAVGSAAGDLVWEVERLVETPGPRPYGTRVEMIDGALFSTAWLRELDGPASPILLPAGGDLDGDARADLLLWTYGDVDVLSGADGERPWASPRRGIPFVVPPVGGGPGHDLVLVTDAAPQGYPVWTFARVDGATGRVLLASTATFPSYRASATGYAVADDRILLVHLYMDDVGYRTAWRVEDVATAHARLTDDRAGIQAMLVAGDLDGDGGEDLARVTLDFRAPEGFALGLAGLDGVDERWSFREAYPSLPGIYAWTAVDVAGGPGDDVLLSVIRAGSEGVASRLRVLDGATGAVAWQRDL